MTQLTALSRFTLRRWPLAVASGILVLSMVLCTRPPAGQSGGPIGTPTPTPTMATPKSETPTPTATPALSSTPTPTVTLSDLVAKFPGQTLVITDGVVPVGGSTAVDLVLTSAAEGMSGFDILVELDNTQVGQFVGTALADFGLTDPNILPDGRSVRIRAADVRDVIPVGSTAIKLATLYVKGNQPGTTTLKLSLMAMDDDSGQPVQPQVVSGQLQVVSSGS